MGKLWSFIVAHFGAAWNSISQWFQKPRRITLISAIVFLMLASVLTSALVVNNMYIQSVHLDPQLSMLFQWTAYVSAYAGIVYHVAFAVAGLFVLIAVVSVFWAVARAKRKRVEVQIAVDDATIDLVEDVRQTANELARRVVSGEVSPVVAAPVLGGLHEIIESHNPAHAESKNTPQVGASERGRINTMGLPAAPSPPIEAQHVDEDSLAHVVQAAELVEVEERRLSE